MPKTFIEVAELILRRKRRPMKPDEIYTIGKNERLINSKGKTPELSMKARISTDIREKGFLSKFMRTGPNKFALREFGMKEFIAQPFKKSIPKEIVTCLDKAKIGEFNYFGFIKDPAILEKLFIIENLKFIDRTVAESNPSYKQLISYVLLQNDKSEILTYKRGVYTNAHEMLKGSTCLGFGGHVQEMDTSNIFSKGLGGVFDTAEREVYEELKGYIPQNLKVLGFINDDSSPEGLKHIGVVLTGQLPKGFEISSFGKELSVNNLKFMSINEVWEQFYEFEFWSQLLIKGLLPKVNESKKVVIKPEKFNITSNILVFVGEIASGKTVLCELLNEKLGFTSISTRRCVAKLINAKDFGVNERTLFQKKAEKFISKKESPKILANEIKRQIDLLDGSTVMIDGIRHYETLKALRNFYPELIVIYVDNTRDDAFRNYINRGEKKSNIDQFRIERHHPVEKEIKLLKGDADAYVFNGGDREELYNEFMKWFKGNMK